MEEDISLLHDDTGCVYAMYKMQNLTKALQVIMSLC